MSKEENYKLDCSTLRRAIVKSWWDKAECRRHREITYHQFFRIRSGNTWHTLRVCGCGASRLDE